MTRYVALLGSINVGGNRLKMAELKAALERAGFKNVATVIASGNVLFNHAGTVDGQLEETIAGVLQESFGIAACVVVRSAAELKAAVEESPFANAGEDTLVHVNFLEKQPDIKAFELLFVQHAGRGAEKLAPGTRALHVNYIDGVAGSKLTSAFVARRLGCCGTARNVRSIRRIIEKMEEV